jgi:hypothetical protein
MGGSRICTIAGADQSGADDVDITGWTKTDEFIIAININSAGKETEPAAYKLKWRDVTDEGVFADVAATGEIDYDITDSSWADGDAVATGDQVCDSQGKDTRQAGERNKDDNLTDSIDLPDEYQSELWFALNCEEAEDGHVYEFELWDSTTSRNMGTVGATIAVAAGLTHYSLDVLAGAFAFAGIAVNLLKGFEMVPSAGAFPFVGSDVTLSRTRKLVTAAGAFPFAGSNVTLLKDSIIIPAAGAFPFVGSDVNFKKGYSFPVEAGAFAFAGSNVTLKKDSKIVPGAGAFAFAGSNVSLLKGYEIVPGVGAFPFAGSGVNLLKGYVIVIGSANFPFVGSDVTLTKSGGAPYVLTVDPGAFPFVGSDVNLIYIPVIEAVIDEGHAHVGRRKQRIFRIDEDKEIVEIVNKILTSGMLD